MSNIESKYAVPAGKYRGKIESATLKESLEKGTPFYDCVCVITEDVEVNGKNLRGTRVPWSGFITEEQKTALRTIRSLTYAGCTFPDNDFENFAGLGSKEVEFDVEEEDPYTPEATSETPEPKTIYRSRVAWVNQLVRGMVGKDVDAGKKKAIGSRLKGLIGMVKSGGSTSTGEPGADIPVDSKGRPKF